MKFSLGHIATLCKYTGISFIAGAVTHGAFSEQRSMITAAIGVAIYLIAGVLEKISNPQTSNTWTNLLAIGVIASVGLGFFTGGLQHFPDSPDRSLWVVPAGFLMSLIAVYWMEGRPHTKIKGVLIYGSISVIIVTIASIYAANYFKTHSSAGGHAHGAAEVSSEKDTSKEHDHSTHKH